MQLFKLVAAHVPLELLSRALVDKFHMAPRPAVIGNSILATVALQVSLQFFPGRNHVMTQLFQRRVASPLAPKKNTKGADTGFWSRLNREMRELVAEKGDDRKDPRWLE